MDNLTFPPARPRGDQKPPNSLSDGPAIRASKSSLEELFLRQVAERCAPPSAIFWQGDPATHVFYLLEGCLRVYRTMEDGRRAILCFGYAGDFLCLSDCETYLFTAEAVTPIRFRRLSRHRLNDLVEERVNLRAQLHAEICREIRAAQDQIIRLGRTGADERVAAFLINVAQRTAACMIGPVEVEIPFRRLDIADYLGLTIETISREISKLNRDGLISMNGPHKIVLRRLRGLREIARTEEGDEQIGERFKAGLRSV
jgi:CRP/FNR family transcriptional regulator